MKQCLEKKQKLDFRQERIVMYQRGDRKELNPRVPQLVAFRRSLVVAQGWGRGGAGRVPEAELRVWGDRCS